MSLQFEIGSGGSCVAPGNYRAKFVGVEPTEHEEFGAGLKWIWKVSTGDKAGEVASRITTPSPTLKNACGRMISGITGQSLTAGSKVNLDEFVGKEFLLQVGSTPSGSSRVESVISMDA